MKQDAKAARTRNQSDRLRTVAGRHNQRLKELRLAFRNAERTPQGECAIEGVKLLEEALRSGQHLESVFFSESARPLAEKLLPQIGARTETLVLPNALFNSIVPSDAPQGVAALVKLPAFSSAQLLVESGAHFEQAPDASIQTRFPFGHLGDSRQDLQQRALARAIAADEAEHFTAPRLEAHVFQGPELFPLRTRERMMQPAGDGFSQCRRSGAIVTNDVGLADILDGNRDLAR